MGQVIVLIPAIPARRENLIALLEDLRAQTRVPDRVVMFLNGWSAIDPAITAAVDAFPCATELHWSTTACGPGIRWRYLSTHAWGMEDVAVTLDDDFRIESDFIARTVAALTPDVDMVAWTGHRTARRYLDLETTHAPCALWIGGTGAAAVWIRAVLGIHTHPLAETCLGIYGDEEMLVSLYIWEGHGRIQRPAGRPPIRHVPALQYAETASHKLHGDAWRQRRQRVIAEYGWESSRDDL